MKTPTLDGHGIRLEPIALRHLAALQVIAINATLWRHMNFHIRTAADVKTWVEDCLRDDAQDRCQTWVTCLASGQVVGSSRLFDLQPAHRTGEIGFTWLAEPFRGIGVNARVKLLQLTHAFETLELRRVALKTHHENLQSQRAILKLGASYEGTFRNHMVMPDGSARHTAWFSIIAEEWPTVKPALLTRIAAEPLRGTEPAAPDVQSRHG